MLHLNLSGNKKLTDEGLSALGEIFASLVNLTTLNLELSWCEKVTDKGI